LRELSKAANSTHHKIMSSHDRADSPVGRLRSHLWPGKTPGPRFGERATADATYRRARGHGSAAPEANPMAPIERSVANQNRGGRRSSCRDSQPAPRLKGNLATVEVEREDDQGAEREEDDDGDEGRSFLTVRVQWTSWQGFSPLGGIAIAEPWQSASAQRCRAFEASGLGMSATSGVPTL